MKKTAIVSVVGAFIVACSSTNPFTNSKGLNIVSNDAIFPTAFQQYSDFLKENKVVSGTKEALLVENVGKKIQKAAETYLASIGQADYLKDYRWEFKLVQDDAVNAWCMPGGKIVVYTGILPVTKTEAGLATVMGHELAHALANHGAQRMSNAQLQQLGAVAVQAATGNKTEESQAAWQQAYGIGSNVLGVLPFSRKHESEADEIGLTLMAIAGYNPDEAVSFWQRMSAASGGGSTLEILSTHPSDATRVANLQKLIPQAKTTAKKFGVNF